MFVQRMSRGLTAALCVLLVAACSGSDGSGVSDTDPTGRAAAESVAAEGSPEVAETPRQPFVSVVCDGMGGLMGELEAMGASFQAQSQGQSGPADQAQLEAMASSSLRAAENLLAGIDRTEQALAAAEPPTFEGGDAVAARARDALTTARGAIDESASQIRGLDPANPDYAMELLTPIMGLAMAAFPFAYIFIDSQTMANGAGMSPAQLIANSPGSPGLYREARDNPNCAIFFKDYDRAELDALLGG